MARIKGLTSRPKKKKVFVQAQPAAEEPLATDEVDAAQCDHASPTSITEEGTVQRAAAH